MKVILLQDVAKIGQRSDLVEVPDGYALNQLIPKRMAEPATVANQKRIAKQQTDVAKSKAADEKRFTAAAEALKTTTLPIAMEANEQSHLFKAVNESVIAAAANAAGIDIEPSMIAVDEPIKALGTHEVSLVRGEQSIPFTIEVVKK